MTVSPKQHSKKSAKQRQSMRFEASAEARAVSLISKRDEKYEAEVIDFSRNGLGIAFSDGPDLTVDQDVLIADEHEVRICNVRNIKEEDGKTHAGLLICHTFPISKLPEKQRAQWGYGETISPFPIASITLMALLFFTGLTVPVALMNLGGTRDRLAQWAGQPQWAFNPKSVAAEPGQQGPQPPSGTASRQRSHPVSGPQRVSKTNGVSRNIGRPKSNSTFTMDDALPQFSGSL